MLPKKPKPKAWKPEVPALPETVQGAAPFGPELQAAVFKLLLNDGILAAGIIGHYKPEFFTVEPLAWAWSAVLAYRASYGRTPSFGVIIDLASRMNDARAATFASYLAQVQQIVIADAEYLRARAIEFVRKAIFKQAFMEAAGAMKAGKIDEAYDIVMPQMEVGRTLAWAPVDRGFFAEEFVDRFWNRQNAVATQWIPTGLTELDQILEGGAYPNFLGVILAYPKTGKTTTLVNLGIAGVKRKRKVMHYVLESSRAQTEARYDAAFTEELYSNVKRGEMDSAKFARLTHEINAFRGCLAWRAFSESWETTVAHISRDLDDMRVSYGWEPDLLVIDYGDLLHGQTPGATTTETQKEAFQNLKTLSGKGRGYAIWTASQVQRPDKEDYDIVPRLLRSKDIADAYAKVRIADFIGSINQTVQEREHHVCRLFAELYRDNAANKVIPLYADFSRMLLSTWTASTPPWQHPVDDGSGKKHGGASPPALGYGFAQKKNGV